MSKLFDDNIQPGDEIIVNPDGSRVNLSAFYRLVDRGTHKTCRTCVHRQRWQCGGRIIQYCGMRKSNRTFNGLMKIKVTNTSCGLYKEDEK